MNAKKKLLIFTSLLLLVAMCFTMLVGCKSSEEKQKSYYEKIEKSVNSRVTTLDTLTQKALGRAWTAKFLYAYTYYGIQEAVKDGNGDEIKDGNGNTITTITPNTVSRGDDNTAGWQSGSKEFVHFMQFEVDYTDAGNYIVKTTTFEDTSRKNYYDNKDKVGKFKKLEELTYVVANGTGEGSLSEGVDPIVIIKTATDGESIKQNGIGASDDFRIYTHFMRIETRQVFDADRNAVTKAVNDALDADGKYWTGYGEDIKYDWAKVYGMSNNRLTVLYNKVKKRIDSLEIYNEQILSYYTKKDKVHPELVLKADVVGYYEMVVEFKYKKF